MGHPMPVVSGSIHASFRNRFPRLKMFLNRHRKTVMMLHDSSDFCMHNCKFGGCRWHQRLQAHRQEFSCGWLLVDQCRQREGRCLHAEQHRGEKRQR